MSAPSFSVSWVSQTDLWVSQTDLWVERIFWDEWEFDNHTWGSITQFGLFA